ncbi:exostosin family protein [Magnetospirillum sp. ME-1]|uniref:exostosin family protein n=1 Tax=Magnetospirillum sp. ME-1 TaxID=1639348 RepID=UPI00143D41B8|nr:exostosin family protein [Magnetospirillum sp. ME-1]
MTRTGNRVLTVLAPRQLYDFIMETGFIRDVLLSKVDAPVRMVLGEQDRQMQAMDDVLVIDFENRLSAVVNAFAAAPFRNVGVLHMADETLSADCSYYPKVDYVLRNYWRPEALEIPAGSRCQGAIWVPNGYRTGVGPCPAAGLLPFELRTTPMTFIGRTPPELAERHRMMEVIQANDLPARLETTLKFGGEFSAHSYRAVMEDTRFALVPGGNSVETIRLYDALETGAIPVCLDAPFLRDERTAGGIPAVILSSWDELPRWWQSVEADPARYADLQRQVIAWWTAFKERQADRVAELINNAFARSAG